MASLSLRGFASSVAAVVFAFTFISTLRAADETDVRLNDRNVNRGAPALFLGQTSTNAGTVINYCNFLDFWVHLQNIGWTHASGAYGGTVGQSRRLEAIRLSANCREITYQAHVQNFGWMAPVSDGAQTGTTGRSLRMEAVRIRVNPGHIFYMTHLQNIGWTGPYQDWAIGGTTGQSRRLEAIAIRLSDTPELKLPPKSPPANATVTLDGPCEKRFWWQLGHWPSFEYRTYTTVAEGDVWLDDPFYKVFGANTCGNWFQPIDLSQPTAAAFDDGSVRVEVLRKTHAVRLFLAKASDHVHYRAEVTGTSTSRVSCDVGHLQFAMSVAGTPRF